MDRSDEKVRSAYRRTVDYFTPMGKYMIHKSHTRKRQSIGKIRPDMSYLTYLLPPNKQNDYMVDSISKFVHVSTNKSKHIIHAIKWTPDGRRILVSSHIGEFTIWNGLTFNFESIMQAHDSPIISLNYSNNGEWLISGDQSGCIKFWQPNFNNVNIIQQSHENSIQDLKFSPNDSKFVSCSDDQTLKIWNFKSGREERTLKGHHWDVKSCDWHNTLGLIVSGSKDNLIKFWDPRMGKNISTLHDFKHTIIKTRFQPNGNQRLLAACSKDHSTRIFDIRTMKSISIIKSNDDNDLSSIVWNPVHSSVLTIGGYEGSVSTFNLDKYISPEQFIQTEPTKTGRHDFLDSRNPLSSSTTTASSSSSAPSYDNYRLIHKIPHAHEKSIFTMEYHPLGHLLCTAGADKLMKIWSRSRPNDVDAFNEFPYTGTYDTNTNVNINASISHVNHHASTGANSIGINDNNNYGRRGYGHGHNSGHNNGHHGGHNNNNNYNNNGSSNYSSSYNSHNNNNNNANSYSNSGNNNDGTNGDGNNSNANKKDKEQKVFIPGLSF